MEKIEVAVRLRPLYCNPAELQDIGSSNIRCQIFQEEMDHYLERDSSTSTLNNYSNM